jgi:hypothetical protein
MTSLSASGLGNLVMNGSTWVPTSATTATYANSAANTFMRNIVVGARQFAMAATRQALTSSDAAYGAGHPCCVKVVRNAYAAGTNTWSYPLAMRVDGSSMAGLKWGTSDGQAVTLSFWYQSNVTGNHWAALLDQCSRVTGASAPTVHYEIVFNVPDASWHQYAFNVPAPPTGSVWNTLYNVPGILLVFLNWAPTPSRATANAAWETTNTADNFAPATVSGGFADWYNTAASGNNNSVSVTGVQLQTGTLTTTPPYKFRPYMVDLLLTT